MYHLKKVLCCTLLACLLMTAVALAETCYLPVPPDKIGDRASWTGDEGETQEILDGKFLRVEMAVPPEWGGFHNLPYATGSEVRRPYERELADGSIETLYGFLFDTDAALSISYEYSLIYPEEEHSGFRGYRCLVVSPHRDKVGPTPLLGPAKFVYEARRINPNGFSHDDAIPVLRWEVDATDWESGHVEEVATQHLETGEDVAFTVTFLGALSEQP